MFEIKGYVTDQGEEPYANWLANLADRTARARIVVRVSRMSFGNLGDVKPIGDGVWEARVDHGPGYRIYYAQAGKQLILLLLGGDKRRQKADIEQAKYYWTDWQQRRKQT
jgi:putative addiction module killer protein